MPVKVSIPVHPTQSQAVIIADATPENDGVMTALQAAELAALVAGGGGAALRFTVVTTTVNASVDYGQLMEADATGGHINISMPLASGVTPNGPNVLVVKNSGTANTVGLRFHVGDGTDTGVTSLNSGEFVMLVSDGVNTFIVVSEAPPAAAGNFNVVTVPGPTSFGPNFGDFVVADATTGAVNVNLPLASSVVGPNMIAVRNDSSIPLGGYDPALHNTQVTVRAHAGDSVDVGGVLWPGDFVYLVSDGVSNWYAVAAKFATNSDNLTPVITANYGAVPGDFVQCDPSAGAFTVTLPPANTGIGVVVEVKSKVLAALFNVTVVPQGGDTIDGQDPAIVITAIAAGESIRFVSDGVSDWMQV